MKKQIYRFLFVNLVALLIVIAIPILGDAAEIVESGSWGENVTYTIDSDGLLTISGTGNMLLDYEYAPWYPNRTAIKEVVIENGVTNISDYAFLGCTELISITIPSSVKWIGWLAFDNCTSLSAVYLSDIATWCDIYFHYNFENPLYYAGNLYLNGELVTELIIPETVTKIQPYAFNGCTSLTSVTIPSSVTSIETGAFGGCSALEEIIIGNKDCQVDNSADTIPVTTTIHGYAGSSANVYAQLYNYVFVSLDNTDNIIIDVEYFGDNIIWILDGKGILTITGTGKMPERYGQVIPWEKYITNIKEVVITDGITSIPSYSFDGGLNIQEISIPESVTSIGTCSFRGCSLIDTISLPENLTYIGNFVFANCSKLQEIVFPCGVSSIMNNTFEECISLKSVTIPSDVTAIESRAFSGCINLQEINLPNKLTAIGAYAFSGCSSLKDITMPSTVTSIANGVFSGCIGLKSITLPRGITDISDFSFYGCSNLESIFFSGLVANIGSHSFNGCTNLRSITLPSTVTSIGSCAFYDCANLQSISIPENVTSIGTLAFCGCKSIQSIALPEKVTVIADSTFSGCDNLQNVSIPNSVISIGRNAFAYCKRLKNISMPNNITTIADSTFFGCDGLEDVTIPNNVTSIEKNAFSYCTNLNTIILGDNIQSIGEYAFSLCDALCKVGYTKNAKAREEIIISSDGNEDLLNSTWYYNYCKSEHQYSGDCDTNCDKCDFPRSVDGSHTYTNNCDESCDICGAIRYVYHTYTDECDSICNVCNYERVIIYDYTITTDEEITLSYSSDRDVEFVISDTSVAYVRSTGKSSIIVGSYVSIKTSVTITPKKPGSVIVSVVDSYNNVLTKALLLINEGEHQLVLSEIVSEQSCVNPKEYIYKCKFCTCEEKVYEDPLGHTYTNTCDPICDRCFAERTELNHANTTIVEAVDATCSAVGYTSGVYCNDCNKYITGHEEIAVNNENHRWDSGKITTPATCVAVGVKTYTCHCGDTYTEVIPKLANAHNYQAVVTAPTCTEQGYTTYTCVCGESYVTDYKEATSHSHTGKVTIPATYTADGVKTYTCNCGNSYTEVIPKLVATIIESDSMKINGNNIVMISEGTVENLLAQASKGTVAKDKNGNVIDSKKQPGTGMTIILPDGKEYVIVVLGDVDGDSSVTVADARLALRASVGLESYAESSASYKAATVSHGETLAVADARLILRAAVGLEDPKTWLQ